MNITAVRAVDRRFPLEDGAGSDAVHTGAEYGYAVAELATERATGVGIALTLGAGTELVCEAIRILGRPFLGADAEELMAGFGCRLRAIADHPQLRWLGPHKGVTHLALASLVNACFDLWAKLRGVPLWRLLLSLTPAEVVALLDLSYVEDVLGESEASELLENEWRSRDSRMPVLREGYPGYDTSIGWFQFDDARVLDGAIQARREGFGAVKLKVGSEDGRRDVRRAHLLREALGPEALIMLDANQKWTAGEAIEMCRALSGISPYWIEEPTHPDDVFGHQCIARSIAPVKVAAGEHISNRVLFKAFLQAGALAFAQPDCTRLAGVSEFLAVSLMAKKFGVPVAPHVGDMGQIHQHLALFNHIALGHEKLFLEHIPHLAGHFAYPAQVRGGKYVTPDIPGCSTDFRS